MDDKPKKKPRGRPFKKGQSGNPAGRKAELPEIRAAIEESLPLALKLCRDVITSKTDERKDQVAAARIIFEWGLAKPAPDIGQGNIDKLAALVEALK